jgi:hypothetical protein
MPLLEFSPANRRQQLINVLVSYKLGSLLTLVSLEITPKRAKSYLGKTNTFLIVEMVN